MTDSAKLFNIYSTECGQDENCTSSEQIKQANVSK